MKRLLFFVEESLGWALGNLLRPLWPVSAWFLVSLAETLRILPRRLALLLLPLVDTYARVALIRKRTWIKRHRIIGGALMDLDLTEATHRNIYVHPVYERGMSILFRSLLNKGDLVLDIGANVGYYSMLSAAVGAVVYAYEPDPVNYEHLKKNIRLNHYSRVGAHQEAIGAKEGTATLHINPFNRGGNTLAGEAQYRGGGKALSRQEAQKLYDTPLEVEVPVKTVDGILSNTGRVQIIKIDVEGFEAAVFEGMQETLKARKVAYIFCELGKENKLEIQSLMASHGYSCKGITDSGGYTSPVTRDVVFIRD